MTKTTKIIISIIIAVIIIGGIWYITTREPAEEDVIRIGFIGPLSGPVAYTGEPVKNGFALANDQKRFINGKKIEILYENGKCETGEAVRAAKKLMEMDNVKIIVSGVCSSSTLGIAPLVQEKKIILISPVAASPVLTNAGEYVFRIASSSDFMASNAARIVKELGYNKIAIIYELNDYPVGWKEVFVSEFQKIGGEVIIEENFNPGDTDMKTQLIKVKEKNPEAILFTVLSAPSAIQILKQSKELNIDKQLIGNEVFSFKSVINSYPAAAEGMLITTYNYDLDSMEMKGFLNDYKQEYGKDITEEIYGALGYDLYNLLYEAIVSCNGDNPECIKTYLENIGGKLGVSGKYTLDKNGDAIRKVVLRRVEEDELKIVE